MSHPTTPQRSGRASEDSTPLSRNDATPSQLTPRSKVKAMLAAFSDDSEEDHVSEPRKALRATKTPPRTPKSIITREARDSSHASGDSEDIPVAAKPRGRLAGRMLVQKSKDIGDADNDSDRAYERVRKQLLGSPEVNVAVPKTGEGVRYPKSPIHTYSDSGDGIEHAASVRRKLTKLKERPRSLRSTPSDARKTSPGLFVSPELLESNTRSEGDSDSDMPGNPAANARFMALVERKRQERIAKEAEEAEKRRRLKATQRRSYSEDQEDGMESSENSVEERLTQQARPTRKASKKALEEMHRETQRMARNMQLAHEARTKKKITKQSLFERFNYKPNQPQADTKMCDNSSRPQTRGSSSTAASDVEHVKSTPPTSPVSFENHLSMPNSKEEKEENPGVIMGQQDHQQDALPFTQLREADIPSSHDTDCTVFLASGEERAPKLDKGKGRAIELSDDLPTITKKSKRTVFTQPPIRVQPPKKTGENAIDSDSDLEIVHESKPKKYTVFDKTVKQETQKSSSLHALRLLAQLESPRKKALSNKTKSVNPAEMQLDLRRRARQQALQEREERLQQLRDRGVIVPTAEERARDAEEVEDLVAKARQEAETIMKREKAASKKVRKERGEVDPLGESSEEDEDWADDEEQSEIDLSGSEDEEEEASGGSIAESEDNEQLSGEDSENADSTNLLLKDEASEAGEEEKEEAAEDDDIEDMPAPRTRKGRHARIFSEDEDDEENLEPAKAPCTQGNSFRQAIPGLPVSGVATLGLTQMFASTMDDLEMAGAGSQQEQDPLAFLRDLPAPTLPEFNTIGFGYGSQETIKDSQSYENKTQSQTQDPLELEVDLHYSQSQIQYDIIGDSFQALSATQVSDFPDPSQDVGFQKVSPIKNRFATTPLSVSSVPRGSGSTVVTQIIESPIIRRGRLRRKVEMQVFSDEEHSGQDSNEDDFEIPANIFDVMKKAAKSSKLAVPDKFDRKKSEAKGLVDEQAEESEDEYAGLGGVSGDEESGNEADAAEMKEMIDDDGNIVVNEREIAAFYADKARASDEKQVEKLFKDITNGALRRKRGADYDLSDSDDGGEARRRRKQREFAKMRKALLEDENIGRIATNPKKQAFLHAIEDRDNEDGLDFLDNTDDLDQESPDLQGPSDGPATITVIPATKGSKRNRDAELDPKENLPPPHHRKFKRPSTLAEIRQSLSTLIAEPHNTFDNAINVNDRGHSSSDENDEYNTTKRRRTTSTSVIDRVALKRAESAASISETARLAFHDPATSVSVPSLGFRVPALLRRAAASSNNGITTATTTAATERMAGGGEDGSSVKRGGKASSSINFYQREIGRKKVVLETERERKRALKVQVEGRRKGIAGLFGGGGRFD